MSRQECRVMHETIVKDVIDIYDELKDSELKDLVSAERRNRNKYSATSLAKKTSNLVCVFPVMVSTSLSINTATMIAKAIERKAVTMLQLLFSSVQVQDSADLEKIISSFHTNIKLNDKMTVDDAINVIDRVAQELSESGTEVKFDYKQIQAIKEDMQNISFYFEEVVNPVSLNNISVRRDAFSRETIVEADRERYDVRKTTETSIGSADYKKANEVIPTMFNVNYFCDINGRVTKIENSVIGVKARLIPVSASDISSHILSNVEDTNWIIQFLRATTRETSFVKDFLLAIDRAKIDALSASRKGSANPMWKVLSRRAMKSKIKRLLGSANSYMAITTLAVSQEDVDYTKKDTNIGIDNSSIVQTLFDKLNLMCVCIADESLEVVKFMFDTGEGNWENYSFTSLEREDKDNTYKKVVNLMTKVAR